MGSAAELHSIAGFDDFEIVKALIPLILFVRSSLVLRVRQPLLVLRLFISKQISSVLV
jgi:hypothetical protein